MRIFTDLNLNGDTPLRVRPGLGEWGPQKAVTTRKKKRARILAIVFFIVAFTVLSVAFYFFYRILNG
ncbi:MAG: hypothetical protein CR980_01465 [Propionibacteriales bacterium]|nr:MAG: hypothetical protein CR980_01465 [Propionibacteriales bacterium]